MKFRPATPPSPYTLAWLFLAALCLFPTLAQAAPAFTTTASTYAIRGQSYIYDADATDTTDPQLTYTLTAGPTGATVNASTGVVTWPTPTGTGNFTLRVCNTSNECVNQTWSVTIQDGPTYLVFSAGTVQLWPYENNTKYAIYRMSDNTLVTNGTLATAGRMTLLDLTAQGITATTGNLYIVADKPIQLLSGYTATNAGGEATFYYSENNTKVGKIFTGFARKDIMVFCYTADTTGTITPNISVTDVTDADDNVTLTTANATFTGTARDVNNASSGTYWIWNLNSFDQDEFRIQPTNLSSTTNPNCSVLAGVLNGRNDWGANAPSSAPADNGFTYGTRFYTYASKEMTIFAAQADTKVTIRNLSSGPLANNNVTFTLNQGTTKSLWTATLFPQMYNSFTQISNDTAFNGEFVEITSDKPITVNTTAMRSVGSYISAVQLFKRSDGQYEGYCYVNKATASANDIRVYTKDPQTKVKIDTLGGQKNDTSTTFYIGPWTGNETPLIAWQGQTYKYAQAPAGHINAEQIRIVSDRYPVLVVCGDISGQTQVYSYPGRGAPLNNPPTITDPPPPSLEAYANEPYKPNQVVASDPENGPLYYSLTDAPTGAIISPNSGQIIWTPTDADIGKTYTFTVRVMDNEGNFVSKTWTVTVYACRNNATRPCYTGNAGCTKQSDGSYQCTTPCKTGVQTCTSRQWGTTCTGQVVPTTESCNGIDDDCDGSVDNGLTAPNCAKQDGVCAGSKQTCDGTNGWKACDATVYTGNNSDYEATETKCDGKDNDCNGQIDENNCNCTTGQTQACYGGGSGCVQQTDGSYQCTAPCKAGTQTCANGQWGACTGATTEATESCNGIDDDCDGQVDNGLTAPNCAKQGGVCAGSKQTCDGTNGWKACDATAYTDNNADYEATESKCDGKDNDCDGQVDNGLTAPNCTKQDGVCAGAKQTCAGINGWQDCNDAAYTAHSSDYEATESKCDGKDNNCDGSVDEPTKCSTSIPPQIQGVPEKTATATKPYGYKPNVVDPDANDKHTWTGTKLPTGATIDPQTGEVKWTPAAGDAGKEFEFEIQVCDDANLCATQTWKVRVGTSNNLPQIIGTPKPYGTSGQTYGYKPSVRDPDSGDTHTWKGTKLPTGATIDPQTGEISWTPGAADVGKEFEFEIEVCDSAGDCASQAWKVRVDDPPNTAPVISSTPSTNGTTGTAYTYEPKVTDPDTGATHTWTGTTLPTGATIDPQTGKISWTPAAGDDGKEIDFAIRVCDDKNECATQTWKVRVGSGNTPPVISGVPGTTASPTITYGFKPTVTDADSGDTHTWKGNKLPTGATINPQTGEISWTPAAGDAGKTFEFEIEVCDSATPPSCSTLSWRVKVNGATNSPPVIVGAPSNEAYKDKAYTYEPKVDDPDTSDSHTWKLKSGPTGATVDASTGKLSWTPAAADVGKDFEFEVEVCDNAGACSSRKWKVRVYDVNNPPQMDGTPKTWATPSQPYTFEPSVKDPNPSETYTWKGNTLPSGATVDPNTGKISWTPAASDAGKTFDFELELCDSKGLCTKRKWQVRVTTSAPNTGPTITSTPSKDAREDTAYNYKPTVSDPDSGATQAWKLKKGPAGATIDPQTGEIKWTPTAGDVGRVAEFEIEVCDDKGACDSQTWVIKPRAKSQNSPPTITSTPPTTAYVGKPYEYTPTATDPDTTNKHTWKLKKGPSGATIDPQTGKITWTPSAGEADQPADFEIEVCDDATPPACTTQTWTVTPRQPCAVDVDCKTGQVCTPDAQKTLICFVPTCNNSSNACSSGEYCAEGQCGTDPCANNQCANDEACRPSDGKCIKACAGVTCQADQSCVDGACVDDPCKKAGLTCTATERCDNSDTQNPKCVANPCNSQSCRQDRICTEGRCLEDPCKKMTCPDPTTQQCVAGQCVGLTPCKVDVDCAGDDICSSKGFCVVPGCYTQSPQCSQGERCQETSCTKDECPTPGGNACASGEFCRPKDQKCVKSCTGVTCQSGEKCEDGACVTDPCANANCAADEVCVAGTCVKNNCDPTKNNCKHGRICSKRLNGCEDDPCGGVTCPTGETCVEGQCIKQGCKFDEDCNGTDLCVQGNCTKRACTADGDCQAKEKCSDGACIENPCVDKQCAAGEFCKNGNCVPSCAGIFCPDTEICTDGKCGADPCAGKNCAATETCVNGTCTADPCKDGKQLCETGRICRPSGCIDDPCQSVTCPAGQTCKNGQCTGDRTCQVDVDCPGDAVCLNKVCAKPGCYKDQSCQSAQLCQNASCTSNPCDGKTCGTNEYCDPSDGSCKKSCPSCLNGKICQNGSCVDDPCANANCAAGETCDNGTCSTDVCADTATQHCRYGRVCKNNACNDDACAGVTCPTGQTCRNGTCSGTQVTETIAEPAPEPTPDTAEPAAEPAGDAGPTDQPLVYVSGGCGCQQMNTPQGTLWFLALACFLALLSTRRRRRQRR